MFDGSLPEIGDLAALSDAALVDAAGGWSRAEAAACARKQAVMAEIFVRRTGSDADERELWWVDRTQQQPTDRPPRRQHRKTGTSNGRPSPRST